MVDHRLNRSLQTVAVEKNNYNFALTEALYATVGVIASLYSSCGRQYLEYCIQFWKL